MRSSRCLRFFSKIFCFVLLFLSLQNIELGATVLDHAVVGRGAIVAAGALVLSNTVIGDGELS